VTPKPRPGPPGPTASAEFTVAAPEAGRRLDQALAAGVEGLSRGAARRALADGAVFVNDRRVRIASRTVRRGDRIRLAGGPRPEPPALNVAYADDDLIVVDKPAGVPVQPTRRSGRGSLLDAVREHRRAQVPRPYVGLLHRIDRDTSGLVLFTLHRRANGPLARALAAHTIGRRYEALVHGEVAADAGTLDGPIGRADGRGRRRVDLEHGKPAVTHYEVVARHAGATHLRLRLETGRTHQIRVHLAAAGHPVVGDRQYGRGVTPRGPQAAALGAFPRQALHAATLELRHPVTGARLALRSPLPADLAELLELLAEDAPTSS